MLGAQVTAQQANGLGGHMFHRFIDSQNPSRALTTAMLLFALYGSLCMAGCRFADPEGSTGPEISWNEADCPDDAMPQSDGTCVSVGDQGLAGIQDCAKVFVGDDGVCHPSM